MAGYVFAIGGNNDAAETIRFCAETGIYSTRIGSLAPISFEGTLADYMSMKPGDNIYFFCKRRYYGIGELVSVGPDCKYCNFPQASERREFNYPEIEHHTLFDNGEDSTKYRWVCTFRAAPFFFTEGIDTDEILTYKPETFKMLRAFWKVSFIKLSDEENNSLREIFLLRHQRELETGTGVFTQTDAMHNSLLQHDLAQYIVTPEPMLRTCSEGTKVKHEMALEAAVVFSLCNDEIDCLGHWDYVSHQVVASPFKPIDYMDKIDVFAMRYLTDTKIPCKYLVAELKKDQADESTIDQVLKYVDWVCNEYAYGDYEAIDACIIAADYPDNINTYFSQVAQRYFTLGSHPVRNKQWNSLRLIRYSYDNGAIMYTDVTPE